MKYRLKVRGIKKKAIGQVRSKGGQVSKDGGRSAEVKQEAIDKITVSAMSRSQLE